MQTLSRAEIAFVAQGISQDIRQDGRARLEYRHISAERSVLPLAHGSARVSLASGETEVLASVKLELGVPAQATPDRGHIEVSVDYPTRFYARSPSKLRLDDVAELTRMLQSLFTSSGSIDLRALCIAPGRHCWAAYVDVLVLESGGSLLDTMALAVYAALLDARLPRLHLVAGETPADVEVEVDDDPLASVPFPGAEGIPVCVTFLQVGEHSLVDARWQEEACADARIRVAVNRGGEVCAVLVDGESSIAPEGLHRAVEAARLLAPSLYARADAAMALPGSAEGADGASTGGDRRAGAGGGQGLGSAWLADNVGTVTIEPNQRV